MRYREIQDKQLEIASLLKYCAGLNHVEIEVFNPVRLSASDTLKFEEKCLLQCWYEERKSNTTVTAMLPSDFTKIDELSKRYNTNYVAVINSGTFIEKKDIGNIVYDVFISILRPPYIPIMVYNAFTPNEGSFLRTSIYNISTGKLIEENTQVYDRAEKTDLIKAEFYNFFFKHTKHK